MAGRTATAARTATSTRFASGREHDLPYFDGLVHFPDDRSEYEVDGREHHQDVALFTEHYRGARAASHAHTGFRIYVVGSRGSARCRIRNWQKSTGMRRFTR